MSSVVARPRSAGPGEPPRRRVRVVGDSRSTDWTPGSVASSSRSGGALLKVAVTSVTRSRRRSAEAGHLDQPPGPQDADAIADRLDLGQVMRAEQDGLATVRRLAQTDPELLLHQRVEAAGRLIEHEQPSPGRKGGDQRDLLPVTGRVGAAPAVDLQVEPLDQLSLVGVVRADRAEVAEQSQRLRAGEVRPQRDIGRDIGEVPVRRHRVGGVGAEDQRAAGRRPEQPQEQPDGRRLAGTVGPEETEDLTGPDFQVQTVHRRGHSETLGETFGPNRGRRQRTHGKPPSDDTTPSPTRLPGTPLRS